MLGAIIGDVVGSRFEFNNYLKKDFNFYDKACHYTDDTVMTVAIADAVMKCGGDYSNLSNRAIESMRSIGQHYPRCGYGGMFWKWMYSINPKPYNSFGNGSAMRVSACGDVAKDIEEAKDLERKVTVVTHNHPEGIKGAECIAALIFLARLGVSKEKMREYVENFYYPLNFTIDGIRDTYIHNETCQDSVPQAIEAFLEAENFEDTIRIAVSLGGDSDTIAAIAGSIAEHYYSIPDKLKEGLYKYGRLDDRLLDVILKFERRERR